MEDKDPWDERGRHLIAIKEMIEDYCKENRLSMENMHRLMAVNLISSLLTVGEKNLEEVALYLKNAMPDDCHNFEEVK